MTKVPKLEKTDDDVKISGPIYWSLSENSDKTRGCYRPYCFIKGEKYFIDLVTIRYWVDIITLEKTFDLYMNMWVIAESDNTQDLMVKATEILKDIAFIQYYDYTNCKKYLVPRANACKTTHDIIGWKKALDVNADRVIVKIRIPKGTRVNLTTYKCRAECAEILEMYELRSTFDEENQVTRKYIVKTEQFRDKTLMSLYKYNAPLFFPFSSRDQKPFTYKVGDFIRISDFHFGTKECAPGFHFFRSLANAMEY